METARFDQLACRLGGRSNRRRLLGAFATGSVLTAVEPRLVDAEATCSLDLVATVRLGPDAGQFLWSGGTQPGQLHGQLSFGISPGGTLAGALFQLGDGTTLPVVGQATGYALQARIALGDERALILTGVGEQPLTTCTGMIGGLMSGPQPGDLGDWQAMANGTGGGMTSPVLPAPTPTPAEAGCSQGLVWCGQYCANLSNDPANCGYCGTLCGEAESCIDGVCLEDAFCQASMTNCGDACFDLTSDFSNCGACFVECRQGEVCWDGVCTKIDGCADGYVECGGLCVDIMSDPLNCSGCSIWCGDGQVCAGGVCKLADHQCLENGEHCSSAAECCSDYCTNGGAVCATPVCLSAGKPCLVPWDCCSGICNSFDYSYTCI